MVVIDKMAIMIKLGFYVLLPLCIGLIVKIYAESFIGRFVPKLQILNQFLVLAIVWMAMSQARGAILNSGASMGIILLLVFSFHGILLASAGIFTSPRESCSIRN